MKIATLEEEVSSKLLCYGISQNLKGYYYLVEAVVLATKNMELTFELTKGLYPKVAEKFYTTSECVERSMRHAIDKAWRESVEYGLQLSMMFTRKPTNGILIRCLATDFRKEGIVSWNSTWTNKY